MGKTDWEKLYPEWLAGNRNDCQRKARIAERHAAKLTKNTAFARGVRAIGTRHRLAADCYLDQLPKLLDMALSKATCQTCRNNDPRVCVSPKSDHFCANWEPEL